MKETSMTVSEMKDGMELERKHVFVIPPNASMTVSGDRLRLSPREDRGGHMPINHFMRSLAEQKGSSAIGVILSGSGTDGTLGMAEIQAQRRITFAQDQQSAKDDGMPRSVTASVDDILPPKEIARELGRIANHPYSRRQASTGSPAPIDRAVMSTIFQLLRRSTGVDYPLPPNHHAPHPAP